MATQQVVMITETIAGLKRALKRKSYESDSDDEVEGSSNRGNKLQRKARYVRQGQMAVPSGPEVYKEVIEHAGYQRAIINRNPLPIDEDGYELDSEDDDDHVQDILSSVAENNPYSSIRLEQILAPLTAPSDLPNHPTMSRAYTSRTLTDLCLQGRDIMHKENNSLWKVKHLLTQLCGDHPWAPTGLMEGTDDLNLFVNAHLWVPNDTRHSETAPGDAKGGTSSSKTGTLADDKDASAKPKDRAPPPGLRDAEMVDADSAASDEARAASRLADHGPRDGNDAGDGAAPTGAGQDSPNDSLKGGTEKQDTQGPSDTEARSQPNGPPKDTQNQQDDKPFIHPFFLQPESTRPDRDFFMPTEEAEDLRLLLQLYVQRQEEICRGSRRLYEGLLKADRLRKMVLFWSKSEAHSGVNRDLSDGEDWYDKEEWGLDEDLKKGHDDEEEEAQQNQKKTRNRR